jgi:hypothetical protein
MGNWRGTWNKKEWEGKGDEREREQHNNGRHIKN